MRINSRVCFYVLAITSVSCSYYPIEESVGGIENAGVDFETDIECQRLEMLRVGDTYSPYNLDFPECVELRLDPNPVWVFRDLECYQELYHPAELPEAPDFDANVLAVFCDPFGGCEWDILVKSAKVCDDYVEMNFEVVEPCHTCHGHAPKCIIVVVSAINKPVYALAEKIEEYPCW